MDKARARALLDQERRRLEQLGRAVSWVTEETSQALSERLRDRWAALERAEAGLAAGAYGFSILSGRPIPDERLEAFPLAELTVEEQPSGTGTWAGGATQSPGWARQAIPSRCSMTRQPKTMGWSRTMGSDDELGPQANLGVRTTPET